MGRTEPSLLRLRCGGCLKRLFKPLDSLHWIQPHKLLDGTLERDATRGGHLALSNLSHHLTFVDNGRFVASAGASFGLSLLSFGRTLGPAR